MRVVKKVKRAPRVLLLAQVGVLLAERAFRKGGIVRAATRAMKLVRLSRLGARPTVSRGRVAQAEDGADGPANLDRGSRCRSSRTPSPLRSSLLPTLADSGHHAPGLSPKLMDFLGPPRSLGKTPPHHFEARRSLGKTPPHHFEAPRSLRKTPPHHLKAPRSLRETHPHHFEAPRSLGKTPPDHFEAPRSFPVFLTARFRAEPTTSSRPTTCRRRCRRFRSRAGRGAIPGAA